MRFQVPQHGSRVVRKAIEVVQQVNEEIFLAERGRVRRNAAETKVLSSKLIISEALMVVDDIGVINLRQAKTEVG